MASEGLGLVAEFRFVRRQWPLIAGCVALATGAVYTFTKFARPIYVARAVLAFDVTRPNRYPIDPRERDEALAREVLLVTSPSLVEAIVAKGDSALVDELRQRFPKGRIDRILLEARARMGGSTTVDDSPVAAASEFRQRVSVQGETASSWRTIAFSAFDAAAAVRGANLIADAYLVEAAKRKQEALSSTSAKSSDDVEAKRAAIRQSYREQNKGGESQDLAKKQLAQRLSTVLQEDLVRAKADTIAKRARYASLQGVLDGRGVIPAELDRDPAFASAEAKRQAAEARLAVLRQSLGDQHPDLLAAREEVEQMVAVRAERAAAVREAARQAYEQAVALENSLAGATNAAQQRFSSAEVAAVDESVSRIETMAAERQFVEAVQASSSQIVVTVQKLQPASRAAVSSSTSWSDLARAGGAAFIFGLVVALLREGTARRVLDPDEIRDLGARVLGVVPSVRSIRSVVAADLSSAESPLAESYRIIRAYLPRPASSDRGHVFLITSPNPGDGKTTSSMCLANLLAKNGDRVLLIDADLRRPALEEYLNAGKSGGLAAVIETGDVADQVRSIAPNLDYLPAGAAVANPAEVLSTETCTAIFEQARKVYRYVICDAPPVLPVADALILSPLADGVILVVSAGRSPVQAVTDTLRRLAETQAALIGVILNRVSIGGLGYGYYGDYSYERKKGVAPRPSTGPVSSPSKPPHRPSEHRV